VKYATPRQVAAIYAVARRLGLTLESVLRELGVETPEDLSVADASALIDRLKRGIGASEPRESPGAIRQTQAVPLQASAS
jgi:hypothetical protein